jgi:hypothetical protein
LDVPNFYICRQKIPMTKDPKLKNNRCQNCLDKSCATEMLEFNREDIIQISGSNMGIIDLKKLEKISKLR